MSLQIARKLRQIGKKRVRGLQRSAIARENIVKNVGNYITFQICMHFKECNSKDKYCKCLFHRQVQYITLENRPKL